MKDFFNKIKFYYTDNKKLFRKFWVNQLAASLLGIMVTWPVSTYAARNETGILPVFLAFLFCGGFFCFLTYDLIYEIAIKDNLRLYVKKIPHDILKSVKLIAFAYIPTIFFALLGVIFFLFKLPTPYAVVSVVLNMAIHSMYSGLFMSLPESINVLAFPLSLLITLFFAFLAYFLGIRDITLREVLKLGGKRKKE